MIYVRSWDSACPALFSAPTIDEARALVSRLGYMDVWYDTNGSPDEAMALKEKIKDLKDRVEVVEGQRDEAREERDEHVSQCNHQGTIRELQQTVDEKEAEVAAGRKAIQQLGSHLDLMKDIVNRAT